MDARAVELINLELDGRLDEAGRAELARSLEADPAVRALREQLRAVARALAAAPAPELPAGFGEDVVHRAGLPQRSMRVSPTRRYWRGGLALAASVLAAAVVLRFVEQGPAPDQLAGTLAPAVPTISAQRVPGGLQLTLEVPPGPVGELVIEFTDGRRIVFPGIGAGRSNVQVSGGAGEFSATLVRNGVSTPVARRSP